MAKHIKLEGGLLRDFSDVNNVSCVDSIKGKLIGLLDDREERKTCFIIKEGDGDDDIVRFYLDRGRRPATRLLRLFCSKINLVNDAEVEILSQTEDTPGQSRLKLRFISFEEDGEAPYVLPEGDYRQNGERIQLIRTALGLTETEPGEVQDNNGGSETESTELSLEELREHAPTVVGGLDGQTVEVSVHASREVALVRNHPLVMIVETDADAGEEHRFSADDCRCDNARTFRDLLEDGSSHVEFISKAFATVKEREAYVEGAVTAACGSCNHITWTDDGDVIAEILRIQAERTL